MAEERHESRKSEGIVPEIVRKAVASGIRSVFATEEGLRAAIADLLPKEIPGYISTQFESIRGELLRLVSDELHSFLGRINIGKELQKALTALSLEVRMQVRFLPNDKGGVRPSITGTVKPKKAKTKSQKD